MAVLSQPVVGFTADLPADLSNKQVQKRLSPAARKAFFKIAAAWRGSRRGSQAAAGRNLQWSFLPDESRRDEDAPGSGSFNPSVASGRNLQGV